MLLSISTLSFVNVTFILQAHKNSHKNEYKKEGVSVKSRIYPSYLHLHLHLQVAWVYNEFEIYLALINLMFEVFKKNLFLKSDSGKGLANKYP